jgi:predicted phosphate transport protein (TIGR00153 family)
MIFENKKQRRVLELIEEHCNLVGRTVVGFERMVREYLEEDQRFRRESERIDKLESKADQIRFRVGRLMFEGAFLPAYRQDYIDLLENLDRVANKAEDAGDTLSLTRPAIPGEIAEDLREIGTLTLAAYEPVPDMVRSLLDDRLEIHEQVKTIARLETKIDRIQFQVLRRVYRELTLSRIEMLEIRIVVDELGRVSDSIENVADRLAIMGIKRRLA